MTIVVGYVPRREGLAALEAAVAEAARTCEPLVVVNAGADGDPRGTGLADPRDIDTLCSRLTERGVPHEIRQPARGIPPADELLTAAASCGARLVVLGLSDRARVGRRVEDSTVVQVMLAADSDVLVVPFPTR